MTTPRERAELWLAHTSGGKPNENFTANYVVQNLARDLLAALDRVEELERAIEDAKQLLRTIESGVKELSEMRGDEADGGDEGYLVGGLYRLAGDALDALAPAALASTSQGTAFQGTAAASEGDNDA